MILVDSIFVHNSGGKVLLNYLLRMLYPHRAGIILLLDKRYDPTTLIDGFEHVFISPSLISRYIFYVKNKSSFSKVFCFGNIPPPIRLDTNVITYFHNYLLLERPAGYPGFNGLLKTLKKRVIKSLRKNSDLFLVQSHHTKQALVKHFEIPRNQCSILPFYNVPQSQIPLNHSEKKFLYISNGNPHKNHINLLEAFKILVDHGFDLELNLTITSEYKQLIESIEKFKDYGVRVINHGFTDPQPLFQECKYLVYPSLSESFGLGIIEAINFGCDVIAADLPYVHSIIVPTATFDPTSPDSIANALRATLSKEFPSKSTIKIENEIEKLVKLLTDDKNALS